MQTAYGPEAFATYESHAFGHISAQDGNVGDTSLHLQFSNGVLAWLHCAETYGMFADFTIAGDKGTLRFATNPWLPQAEDNVIELIREDESVEQITVTSQDDAFFYEVRLVRDCIERGILEAMRPAPRRSDSYEIMDFLTRWEAAVWQSL